MNIRNEPRTEKGSAPEKGFLAWMRYSLAVLSVAVATGLRTFLDPLLGPDAPFVAFYGVIALSAYAAGLGPGLLALALAFLAADYLFVAPRYIFLPAHFTVQSVIVHGGHLAVGLIICLTAVALRRAMARARATAAELVETNECLCRVLESTTDAVKLVDSHGRLIFLNRRAREILSANGVNPDARLGQRVADETFWGVKDSAWNRALFRALDERAYAEAENYYAPWKSWYSIRCFPTKDGGVAVFFRDITSAKAAEKALINAKQDLESTVQERTAELRRRIADLEELSYTIVHDLRAPLRAMHTCAQYLVNESGERLGETAQDYTRRIIAAAERMDKLLLDVLAYSGVMGAKLDLRPVDTDQLIRDILKTYPQFQAAQVAVRIEGTLPAVVGNEALLTQIVSCLLDNAIKFVRAGVFPQVRIWHEPRGPIARLWFEDNGIGIAQEYHERIFEMFQRLDKSRSGTGAGLAVARKAAERMDGAMGVESEPGNGSRFWVDLKREPTRPSVRNADGRTADLHPLLI